MYGGYLSCHNNPTKGTKWALRLLWHRLCSCFLQDLMWDCWDWEMSRNLLWSIWSPVRWGGRKSCNSKENYYLKLVNSSEAKCHFKISFPFKFWMYFKYLETLGRFLGNFLTFLWKKLVLLIRFLANFLLSDLDMFLKQKYFCRNILENWRRESWSWCDQWAVSETQIYNTETR